MNEQLQQSVGDAVNRNVHVASGFTAGSGALTVLQVLPEILGCISMLVGMAVTIYFAIRKKKMYDKWDQELAERQRERINGNGG